MAQATHDFFMQPFRAFGVELPPDTRHGKLDAIDMVSGRYVTFFFMNNHIFGFLASEQPDGLCTGFLGRAGFMKDETELCLWAGRDFLPNGWEGRKAGNLKELIELFEPDFDVMPPYFEELSPGSLPEASYKANCGALFRFLRFIERSDEAFDKHYTLEGLTHSAT